MILDPQNAFLHLDLVQDGAGRRFLGVDDLEISPVVFAAAAVADLASAFGVERAAVEHEDALLSFAELLGFVVVHVNGQQVGFAAGVRHSR